MRTTTATMDMICLPGMESDVPFSAPPRLARVERVDAALTGDGYTDDTIVGWTEAAAVTLGCAPTLASVAAALWGSVPVADEALYLLAEVLVEVADGSFMMTSPRAHRVARCHCLVAGAETPTLAGVTDAASYISAAARALGADVTEGAQSLGAAQSLADVLDPFVTKALKTLS